MKVNYESFSLGVSLASLLISVAAVWIAKSSLSQAKQVADRDREDWRQRKWFDLYLKANQAYDSLDAFQSMHEGFSLPRGAAATAEFEKDWNNLMALFREVHAMAAVFPRNPATDELFASTAVFDSWPEALSKDRLRKVFDALDGIRQKAFLGPAVLG